MSGSDTTDELGNPLDKSPAPSERVVMVALRNSLISSLIGSDLQLELLPPHARSSFESVAVNWAHGIEKWCTRCLGPDTAPEPAPPDPREAALPMIRERLATPYRPPPDAPQYRGPV